MQDIEFMIISCLLHNKDFSSKVFPHTKKEYFETEVAKTVVDIISSYQAEYGVLPTKEALKVEVIGAKGLPQSLFEEVEFQVQCLYADDVPEMANSQKLEWVLDQAHKFYLDRSCHGAIMESMSILDGDDKSRTRDAIPDLLKDAVSISFENEIGHDYVEDFEKRFEFYHRRESRVKLSLTMLNKIMGGGPPTQSLIVPIAGTGVGKSLYLTSEAAHQLLQGVDVLYITLELAEERVAERIDAKLMNLTMEELKLCSKTVFDSKINNIKRSSIGKLIIKHFPPGAFHSNHLRFLLKELKNKKNFTPRVIMVDYLGLMASYRKKSADDSYGYLKAVTEELRGVGVESNTLVIAPMQSNRSGQNSTDLDLSNMSESHGVSMGADVIFAFISTPEMEQLGHVRIKQLKNRFGCISSPSSFVIGVERAKMRMYDLDITAPVSNTAPAQTKQSSNGFPAPRNNSVGRVASSKGLKI